MNGQFKPVRLTVLIGVTAIIACGVAVFYTHRSAHGTTAEERAVYEIGEKAGEKAPRGATLPAEAELNLTAQWYFEQQGPAQQLQNPSRAGDLQALAGQRGQRTEGSELTIDTGQQIGDINRAAHS